MTAERDESKENRDAVTSVPFRYARYTLYTPYAPQARFATRPKGVDRKRTGPDAALA